MMERISVAISTMTPRERRLFGLLFGVLVVAVLAVGGLAVRQAITDLEEQIQEERSSLARIRERIPRYLELLAKKKATEELIANTQGQSVRVAVNEMLKSLVLSDDVPGATGNTMADIVSFEGKTHETPVGVGGSKKKRRRGSAYDGLVRIEQQLEFRDVPIKDLLTFLDRLRNTRQPLFVTRLEISRKFNNMEHARVEMVVATFQFREEKRSKTAGIGK